MYTSVQWLLSRNFYSSHIAKILLPQFIVVIFTDTRGVVRNFKKAGIFKSRMSEVRIYGCSPQMLMTCMYTETKIIFSTFLLNYIYIISLAIELAYYV